MQQWGSCWNRYYSLSVEHFQSDLSRDTLSVLHHQLLWHQSLSESPGALSAHDEGEHVARDAAHLDAAREELSALQLRDGRGRRLVDHGPAEREREREREKEREREGEERGGVAGWREDHACTICSLLAKKILFCRESRRETQTERETDREKTQSSVSASAMDI